MRVRDVMSRDVEHCLPSANLSEAAMVMWRHDCGIVPIVDAERRVKGVITDRDICMAVATRHQRPEEVPVAHVISGQVLTVREDADLRAALDLMKRQQIRRLPVTDERGMLIGMLSLSDLIRHVGTTRRVTNGELAAHDVLEGLRHIVRKRALEEAALAS